MFWEGLRRAALLEEVCVLLGVGFEISKFHSRPSLSVSDKEKALSATAPALCLRALFPVVMATDSPSENPNQLFRTLPWSWCVFTATDQQPSHLP